MPRYQTYQITSDRIVGSKRAIDTFPCAQLFQVFHKGKETIKIYKLRFLLGFDAVAVRIGSFCYRRMALTTVDTAGRCLASIAVAVAIATIRRCFGT